RLASRLAAATGTRDSDPVLRGGERRLAARCVVVDLGQQHGKLVFWNGDDSARAAVHDRDGTAPVALARDQPVAQAIADGRPSAAPLAEPFDYRARAVGR